MTSRQAAQRLGMNDQQIKLLVKYRRLRTVVGTGLILASSLNEQLAEQRRKAEEHKRRLEACLLYRRR